MRKLIPCNLDSMQNVNKTVISKSANTSKSQASGIYGRKLIGLIYPESKELIFA